MLTRRLLSATCLFICLLAARLTQAGQISSLVVFGDSLSDVGNAYIGTGTSTPPSPPYATGRFSNGPIWVDGLAAGLGLTSPAPFLAGGPNFAFGSSESGAGFNSLGAPNLLYQVGLFLSTLTTPADPSALYVIWAGGNDYLNGQTDPSIPVGNIASAVSALASVGATQFLVLNLSPLGNTPELIASGNLAARTALNALVLAHNAQLASRLNDLQRTLGITIAQPDIHGLYEEIGANPAAFGFSEIERAALADGVLTGAGYLYWDELHPTSAGHALVAARALASVPEPSMMTLAGLAGVLLAGGRLVATRRLRNS